MKKIGFYVPKSHLEVVKNAMFAEGAGQIGRYQHCAWQVQGEGQFLPLDGANPAIGAVNQLQKVCEYYCTMVCEDARIVCVVDAMKKAHPYEEVAYDVVSLESI